MINFEHLVSSFLIELDTTTSSASGSNDSEADIDPLNAYLTSKYGEIQSAYKSKYPSNQLISQSELKNLTYNASNNSLRNVKGSQAFPTLIDNYPIIDLIAELSIYYKRTAKLDANQQKTQSDKVVKGFIDKLKNPKTPGVPINFPATTAWAQLVRNSYLGNDKTQVGTMRLDDIPQAYSIMETIKALLTIRAKKNKSLVKRVKETTINYAVAEMNDRIKEIFTNPQYFIRGQKTPPTDEKMKQLYDDTTSTKLVDISLASFALFNNELTNYVGEVEEVEKIKRYQTFIGTETPQAQEIEWNAKTQTTAQSADNNIPTQSPNHGAPQPLTSSFDYQLLSIYSNFNILLENEIPTVIRDIPSGRNPRLTYTASFWPLKQIIQINLFEQPKDQKSQPIDQKQETIITPKDVVEFIKKSPKYLQKIQQFNDEWNQRPENKNLPKNWEKDAIVLFDWFQTTTTNQDKSLLQPLIQQIVLTKNLKASKDARLSSRYRDPKIGTEENPESTQRPFETAAGSNKFLYSLGNVKKYKDADPFAGTLYEKLTDLADYIKKKESVDWAGVAQGIGQMAKGLSLGVPSMGSR